jgi:hypothetical protein
MTCDIIKGFILVCGVIPLCLALQTQINPWLYGFWINQFER